MTSHFSDLSKQSSNRPLQSDQSTRVFDQKKIDMALEISPSGGNSKPFIWNWRSATVVEILLNKAAAEHYLNRNQHTSWISLGCLIESAEIAAIDQSHSAHIKISHDLSCKISFSLAAQNLPYENKFQALLKRKTSRFEFKTSTTPQILKSVQAKIEVHLVSALIIGSEFKKFVRDTDQYIWLQRKALESFFGEVRFFDHRKSPRGIRSEDLTESIIVQCLLYFFSLIPWLSELMARTPILKLIFFKASEKNIKMLILF
jgi:hypothetical protein